MEKVTPKSCHPADCSRHIETLSLSTETPGPAACKVDQIKEDILNKICEKIKELYDTTLLQKNHYLSLEK